MTGDAKVAAELARFATASPPEDEAIIQAIESVVQRDGAATPAALSALPDLLAWIAGPEHRAKPAVIVMVADLISITGHVRHLAPPAGTRLSAHSELSRELQRAVWAHDAAVDAAVSSSSAETRAALALLWAYIDLEDHLAAAQTKVAAFAQDASDLVRGSALVGLARGAWIVEIDREAAFRETFAAKKDHGTFTRFGAAVGLAPTCEADVVEELLSAVDGNDRPIAAFPWCYGSLREVAVVHLTRACVAKREAKPIVRLLELAISLRALPAVATAMLDLVFPGELREQRPAPRESARDLSEDARWLLERFVEAKANRHGSLDPILGRLGLFAGVTDLGQWLGHGEDLALDDVVEGRPAWGWARALIDGRSDPSAAARALAGLPPDRFLALLEEIGRSRYELVRPWPYAPQSPYQEQRTEALVAELFAGLVRRYEAGAVLQPLLAKLEALPTLDDCGFLCLTAVLAAGDGNIMPPRAVLKKAMTRGDVRSVVARLPEAERNELVMSLPLFHQVDKLPSGELVAVPSPGWMYADLAEGDDAVTRVIENIQKWGSHRRTPINPAPIHRAAETLAGFGPGAKARLDALLPEADDVRQRVYRAALAKLTPGR